eukprot:6415121-Lingulodinium_polyedra.AAC.1
MDGGHVEPWAAHTVRVRGSPQVADRLRQAVREQPRQQCTVWGPEQWRDAVAVFPVRGALTKMLQEAQ